MLGKMQSLCANGRRQKAKWRCAVGVFDDVQWASLTHQIIRLRGGATSQVEVVLRVRCVQQQQQHNLCLADGKVH